MSTRSIVARKIKEIAAWLEPNPNVPSVDSETRALPEPDSAVDLYWHEAFITHLASVVRPKVYVELGLYRCAVFNRIIPYAQRLIGVDRDRLAQDSMAPSEKTEFICASTQEFAQIICTNPFEIDMLFIDADHSKDAVLADFRNLFPFISSHGLILMHDTHPGSTALIDPGYCGTAYLAVSELSLSNKDYELATIPISPGLTICRKRSSQLSWRID
jgi:predicted O-methyltransferase YrrM